MRKTLTGHLFVLTGYLLLGSPMAASAQAMSLSAEQQQIMGLETVTVQSAEYYPSSNFTAKAIIPLNKNHQLSSTVSGKIVALHHAHGEIKQGELIADIESAELVAMQQQLIMAIADLEVAKQNLKRAEALSKSGASSVKNLNSIRAEVTKLESLKSQYSDVLKMAGLPEKALNELLQTQRLQSSRLQVFSPVNGQVYDLEVMLNQIVEKGQTLVTLGETDSMVFETNVPQAFSKQLAEGQKVAIPALNKQAEIGHVHTDVDDMTQTVTVHIKVENADGQILKGQLSEVQFLFSPTQNQTLLQVPASALSQMEGEKVVFAKTASGIEAFPIDVLSIAQGQLFFQLKEASNNDLTLIYSKGSTAIKSAFAATEEE